MLGSGSGTGNATAPGVGVGVGVSSSDSQNTMGYQLQPSSSTNTLLPGNGVHPNHPNHPNHAQMLLHNQAAVAAAIAAGRLPPGFDRTNQGGLMPSVLNSHSPSPTGIRMNQ